MTKTILILAIVLAGFGIPSAYAACSEGDVQHWTNMQISTSRIQHSTQPSFSGISYLPIPTMNSEIVSQSNINEIIADRLNELGYFVGNETKRPVSESDVSSSLAQIPGYSTICKDGITQMIGGMLIQPDATAMFLAYGIANAVWLAPTLAGLGAGIYLTKSKWKKN